MTYETKKDTQIRLKITWTVGGTEYSEKVPIYADTNPEDFIRTVSDFRILLDDNPSTLGANRYAGVASTVFRKMLKDSARTTYTGIVNDLPEPTAGQHRVSDQETLEETIAEATRAILGQSAYNNQIDYLRLTKKPKKLSIDEWMRRIKNINNCIPVIDPNETAMTEGQFVREVVLPNIPQTLKFRLRSYGGDTLSWD